VVGLDPTIYASTLLRGWSAQGRPRRMVAD
jgi:hypothetical protein